MGVLYKIVLIITAGKTNRLQQRLPANQRRQLNLAASDGIGSTLASPDPDRFKHFADKNFPITDLAGVGCLNDGFDHGVTGAVIDDDLNLHLGEEIHRVFTAAVNLGMAFLTAKTFDFHDGHSFDPNLREGLLDVFEFEGLDDRFDFFHGYRQLVVEFNSLQRLGWNRQ